MFEEELDLLEEEELTMFEVETHYKSGRNRTEFIDAKDEEEMWKWYDKHHNADLIESSVITDAYPC